MTGFWELWILCNMYSRDFVYPEYASGSPYNKISQSILARFLIYLGYWICHRSESIPKTTLKTVSVQIPKGNSEREDMFKGYLTWNLIFFLVFINIYFLQVVGRSFRNNALPTILSTSPPVLPPVTPTLFILVHHTL